MDRVKDKNFKLTEVNMNKRINCRYYESCSAQLCPMLLDEQNSNCIWYPDEEICRKRKGIPDWVRQQRKVAKKAKPENCCHYFTLEMLKVRFRVTKSVKGLDPNMDLEKEGPQLKAWHNKYKGTKKRRISDELKETRRQALALARKSREQAIIGTIMEPA
jgi:hypothetical protein